MLSHNLNKIGNKTVVKTLINKGLFDEHIDELSKALYSKRTFTKDIKCFFNNINRIDSYLIPKKRIIPNKTLQKIKQKNNSISINKNKSNSINYDKFHKIKENKINEEMHQLLRLLNDSQEETIIKFQELKDENEIYNLLYKLYKKLINNNNKNSNDDHENYNSFLFLYDLLLKYKSNKSLSFELSSLFSDFLKESPLDTNNLEKLKLYYIINGEKYNNISKHKNIKKERKIKPLININNLHNEDINNNKENISKDPRIIDLTKIQYFKEIKYLNKLNRVAENKIRTGGGKIIAHKSSKKNFTFSLHKEKKNYKSEDEEYDENNLFVKNYEDMVKEKSEKRIMKKEKKQQLKYDIQKDLKDINIIKKTIKDSFISRNEKKDNSIIKKANSGFDTFKKNLVLSFNNNNKIKDNFFSNKKNENKKKSLNNTNINFSDSIINRNRFKKTTSYDNFKITSDENMKNMSDQININNISNFNKSYASNKNNYQSSTLYSNKSNMNNILSKSIMSFNNYMNLSNNIKTPSLKTKIMINNDNLLSPINQSKHILFKESNNKHGTKIKTFKKSKTIFADEDKTGLLENIMNNRTEKIYGMAKIMSKKMDIKKDKENIKKIKNYLKLKNSRLPSLYMGNKLKDTFFFLNRIKNKIKYNNIKHKYQNIRKKLNEKEKKSLEENELLDSNLINKDKELLFKAFIDEY